MIISWTGPIENKAVNARIRIFGVSAVAEKGGGRKIFGCVIAIVIHSQDTGYGRSKKAKTISAGNPA